MTRDFPARMTLQVIGKTTNACPSGCASAWRTLAGWYSGVFRETDVVGAIASVPWLLRLVIPTVAGAALSPMASP